MENPRGRVRRQVSSGPDGVAGKLHRDSIPLERNAIPEVPSPLIDFYALLANFSRCRVRKAGWGQEF